MKLISNSDPFFSKRLNRKIGSTKQAKHKQKTHPNIIINSILKVNNASERIELIISGNNLSMIEFLLFGRLLLFTLRNKYNEDIEEYYSDKHHYQLTVNSQYMIKPVLVAIGLLLGITITQNNDELVFESEEIQFNNFIQQVYILLFLHISANEEYVLSDKLIKNLRKYTKTWLYKLPIKIQNYIRKKLRNPKSDFVKWLKETNRPIPINAHEEIVIPLINDLNINSMIDINVPGNGLLCYAIGHYNKNIKILGISEDNNRTIVARQSKPTYNGKCFHNAYYPNISFVTANPLYPVLINYSPVDLLVISSHNIEDLYLMIADYFQPKHIIYISKEKVNKFKFNVISVKEIPHENVFIYVIECKQSNKPSIWQEFYEKFTENNKYLIYTLNYGFCNCFSQYDGDLNKLYELGLEHYRINKINPYK